MKKGLVIAAVVVAAFMVFQQLCTTPYIAVPSPTGETVICFGDSLTYGTGASPDTSYPAYLSRSITEQVINAGVPGNTTADALERLDRDVLAHDPKIVLITLGGNDLMRDVPRDEAFANLREIVDRIHDRGALAVVGGIKVPLLDRGFAAAYRDLCRSSGCVLVPDILDGIMGNNALMSDRIHPNGDGYELMAERFRRAIEPYLDS